MTTKSTRYMLTTAAVNAGMLIGTITVVGGTVAVAGSRATGSAVWRLARSSVLTWRVAYSCRRQNQDGTGPFRPDQFGPSVRCPEQLDALRFYFQSFMHTGAKGK